MGHRFVDRSSIAAKSIQILPKRFFLHLLVGFLRKDLFERKTRRASLFSHKLHVLCIQLLSHVSTYLYNTLMKSKTKTIAAVWKTPTPVLRYCRIGVVNNPIGFFFSHSVAVFFLCSLGFRLPFLQALANVRQSLPWFFAPNPHLQNGLLGTLEKVACLQVLQVVHISQDLVQKLARLLWFDCKTIQIERPRVLQRNC